MRSGQRPRVCGLSMVIHDLMNSTGIHVYPADIGIPSDSALVTCLFHTTYDMLYNGDGKENRCVEKTVLPVGHRRLGDADKVVRNSF